LIKAVSNNEQKKEKGIIRSTKKQRSHSTDSNNTVTNINRMKTKKHKTTKSIDVDAALRCFSLSPFLPFFFLIAAGFAVCQTFFPFRRDDQALKKCGQFTTSTAYDGPCCLLSGAL
jgi:ATP/ADP translocase